MIEIKELFRVVEANNSNSNFLSRGQEMDEVLLVFLRSGSRTSTTASPATTTCSRSWSRTRSGGTRWWTTWANGST